eukprot:1461837-Prymnesium_polylepis.1
MRRPTCSISCSQSQRARPAQPDGQETLARRHARRLLARVEPPRAATALRWGVQAGGRVRRAARRVQGAVLRRLGRVPRRAAPLRGRRRRVVAPDDGLF